MQKLTQTLFAVIVIVFMLCAAILSHAGQAPVGVVDPRELEAFFDSYLSSQMSANHVAGATVAVVKDGQVLFSKGYGYADVTQQIPVDPEKTMFVIGSLTKIFTWTAVMQLVEQGKLDLNADINTYLDFTIPATYPQPITLNHLMAHNSGFEDNKFGQMSATPEQMIPLGEWLKTHIPARIYAPGVFSAYGNYNAALAGYIVERVSGMSYDDYIDKNILIPLGMTHTSSRQPLPSALKSNLSHSYLFVNDAYQPQPAAITEVIINPAPAGSIKISANDMARFMIAHLNDGRYGDASILQPATAQLMHRRNFSHDPRVNGFAHGFWELDMNGQRIIGHAGSHFIFNGLLLLFPEHKLGVFIATNSQGGSAFIGENFFIFAQAFVQHYFPKDVPPLAPPSDFAQRAGRFSGSYHMTMGRSETTPEKLFALMSANIKADRDGLSVNMSSGKERFIESEPLVFRHEKSDKLLVFREDDSGNINQVFYGPVPVTALIKNRWFETFQFNLTLLGVCVILFLSFLIVAPIAFFVQRRRANRPPSTPLGRTAQLVAGLTSLLSLLLLFGVFASMFNIYGLYTSNLPLWNFILIGSILAALLALGMIIFTVLAWKQRYWGLAGRIHYMLVTGSAAAFVWFLYFWNLLGRNFV